MKYYDLTLPLSPASVPWPGDQKFQRQERRGSAIVSKLTLSTHTGTHIDAPKHFLFNRGGIDSFALNQLVGKFTVYFVGAKSLISLADVKKLSIQAGMRVLFKTRNSGLITKRSFTANYVSLSLEAAQYLASKKVLLVGIDYFGVEAKSAPGHPVHKALLSKNIVIAESLNLKNVKPGTYSGAILPLLIKDGDGAPARAVLWG
jgi:arylformamidase